MPLLHARFLKVWRLHDYLWCAACQIQPIDDTCHWHHKKNRRIYLLATRAYYCTTQARIMLKKWIIITKMHVGRCKQKLLLLFLLLVLVRCVVVALVVV
jgi:hypothetical protein